MGSLPENPNMIYFQGCLNEPGGGEVQGREVLDLIIFPLVEGFFFFLNNAVVSTPILLLAPVPSARLSG